MVDAKDQADDDQVVDEQKAVEQERVDTFWAVFLLGSSCLLRHRKDEAHSETKTLNYPFRR